MGLSAIILCARSFFLLRMSSRSGSGPTMLSRYAIVSKSFCPPPMISDQSALSTDWPNDSKTSCQAVKVGTSVSTITPSKSNTSVSIICSS